VDVLKFVWYLYCFTVLLWFTFLMVYPVLVMATTYTVEQLPVITSDLTTRRNCAGTCLSVTLFNLHITSHRVLE